MICSGTVLKCPGRMDRITAGVSKNFLHFIYHKLCRLPRGGGKRQKIGEARPRRDAQRLHRGQGERGRGQDHHAPRRHEEQHPRGDHPPVEADHLKNARQVCSGQAGCCSAALAEPQRKPQAELRSCTCQAPTQAVAGEGEMSCRPWYPMQGYMRTSFDPK